MKFVLCLIFCAVIASLCADSESLPAKKRMVYYQQPTQWYAAPQRLMYVQYVQPSRTHARSTQAAAALVAGDSVATGTYLKDCNHAEAEIAAAGPSADTQLTDDELAAAGAHAASSVAEAYPEVPEVAASETDTSKVPREYQFEAEQPAGTDLAAAAPLVPEAQATEEEEHSVGAPAGAESDDDNEIEQYPLHYPQRKPTPSRKPSKRPTGAEAKPLPNGTFFPINFGGTAGGAIAIANSFSTGEGGTATSHAVAYGSPEAARIRGHPIRRH